MHRGKRALQPLRFQRHWCHASAHPAVEASPAKPHLPGNTATAFNPLQRSFRQAAGLPSKAIAPQCGGCRPLLLLQGAAVSAGAGSRHC